MESPDLDQQHQFHQRLLGSSSSVDVPSFHLVGTNNLWSHNLVLTDENVDQNIDEVLLCSRDDQINHSHGLLPNTETSVSSSPNGATTESKRHSSISEQSQTAPKKPRFESSCASPIKVRKEKLGDRIQALQQLVAPFGKTDTASVLMEAIGYIKFLHGQVQTLSVPYMRSTINSKSNASLLHGASINKVSLDMLRHVLRMDKMKIRSRNPNNTLPIAPLTYPNLQGRYCHYTGADQGCCRGLPKTQIGRSRFSNFNRISISVYEM
ncbi:hypothetical protein QJS10_CPA01g01217 [Acorus calamus]|uniref:BHLH domain-containing protein n=1 Tax=Acorus calamus TaxID=4465 RepID=A0AAV9FNI0_ACOCL|nr:hypothetical protein QJS10_CPA01g01217 [Acorus calamus]